MNRRKDEINTILDMALPAFNSKTTSVNTNNGIMNESYLEKQKTAFMRETMEFFKEDLIRVKQEYPQNDISDVQLTTDFFILPRKEYLKLKELINIDND